LLALEEQERPLTIGAGKVKAAKSEADDKGTMEKAETVEAVKTPNQEEL